jgi:hypothetical protein
MQAHYLRGLLLAAAELGLIPILDEAEKLFEGDVKNRSFAGLEHFLTRSPGEVFTLGDIKQTLPHDFRIFMTMNIPNVPEHILSRFAGGVFELSAQHIDRLKVIIARTYNEEGASVLPLEVQKKLLFLATTAWDAFAKSAKEKGLPWDFRVLNTVLDGLVFQDKKTGKTRPTGTSFSTVCQKIAKDFPELWGRFTPLHDRQHALFHFLEESSPQAEASPRGDVLLSATQFVPVSGYVSAGWTRQLAGTEIEQLEVIAQKRAQMRSPETPATSLVAVASGGVALSLVQESTHPATVRLPQRVAHMQELAVSSWGDFALLESQNAEGSSNFAVISTTMTESKPNQAGRNEETARVFLEGISGLSAQLAPDGKSLAVVCQDSTSYRLDVYATDAASKDSVQPSFSISLSSLPQAIEFTSDGQYMLIKTVHQNSGHTMLLKISDSIAAKTACYLSEKSLPGLDWNVAPHLNNLFIWNKRGQGYCLS